MKSFQMKTLIIVTALGVAGIVQGQNQTRPSSETTQGAGARSLQQNAGEQSQGQKQNITAESFIKESAMGHQAEIQMAGLALKQSSNQSVQQLARQLQQDHQSALQQLRPLAQARGIELKPQLDAKHEQQISKIRNLSGSEFDQAFAKHVLRDHQKDIQKYQQASQQLQDADLKQYAQTTLPTLRQHLQHGRQTAQGVGVSQETITSILQPIGGMGGSGDIESSQQGQQNQRQQNQGNPPHPSRP